MLLSCPRVACSHYLKHRGQQTECLQMRVVENRFTDAGNQFVLIDTSLDILAD